MTEHDAEQTERADIGTVVYCIQAANRPGMAHSIAAVFAHRGLSIDTFVSDSAREPTRILAEFTGTVHQQRMVQRALERLHYVTNLVIHPIDSPALRGVVLCELKPRARLPKLGEVTTKRDKQQLLVHGQLAAVSAALAALRKADAVASASRSIIAL